MTREQALEAAAIRCISALAANGAPNCEAVKEARAALDLPPDTPRTSLRPQCNCTDDLYCDHCRVRDSAPDMLAALRVALNEIHHPGAAAYEKGEDITVILERAIARATGREG